MNDMGPTDTEPILNHLLTDAENDMRHVCNTIGHSVVRRFVRDEQRTTEVIGLGFDSAVMYPSALVVERRRHLMAQKTMRQFMADVAALTIGVMAVIMHDRRSRTAGNRHSGKMGLAEPLKRGGVAIQLAHLQELDIKMGAGGDGIKPIDRRDAEALAYAQRNAIGLSRKSTPQSQS